MASTGEPPTLAVGAVPSARHIAPSSQCIESLYAAMLQAIGPTGWWPADTKFEIMVGAVLTQNTAWGNVARSLDALKHAEALTPQALMRMDAERVQELIRPSGFYRNKAKALHGLSQWFVQRCGADPASMAHVDDASLRAELLSLFGVGGETADDLMLYVFDRRAFVADSYARRLFAFCGWDPPRGYGAFHDAMIDAVLATSLSVRELQEWHGLIDEFGKTWRTEDDKARSPLAPWKDALRRNAGVPPHATHPARTAHANRIQEERERAGQLVSPMQSS